MVFIIIKIGMQYFPLFLDQMCVSILFIYMMIIIILNYLILGQRLVSQVGTRYISIVLKPFKSNTRLLVIALYDFCICWI